MRSKFKYSSIARLGSVVSTILFMWCFGTALLIVILNIGIGFADNTADFHTAFLNMIVNKEYDTLQNYLELSVHANGLPEEGDEPDEDGDNAGLQLSLQSYKSRYDAENTNLRFSATDEKGNLLLTNDPDYGSDEPLLASSVTPLTVSLASKEYLTFVELDDPLNDFPTVIGTEGGVARCLEKPEEFSIWYFTDSRVNDAFNEGLDVVTLDGEFTDYMIFSSEEEAESFDYESVYGQRCTTEICASAGYTTQHNTHNDVESTLPEEDDSAEEDDTTAGGAEPAATNVVVKIWAYGLQEKINIPLKRYYEMKRDNLMVYAVDDQLEELLMDHLGITIVAYSSEDISCILRTYLPENLKVEDTIRSNYSVFFFIYKRAEMAVLLMFVSLVLTVISCIIMCTHAGYSEEGEKDTVSRIHNFSYEIFYLMPLLILIAAVQLIDLLSMKNTPYRMIAIFCIGMILCIAASCTLWLYTTAIRVKCDSFWRSFGLTRLLRHFFGLFRNKTVACILCMGYAMILFALNAVYLPDHKGQYILMLPVLVIDFLTLLFLLYCIYSYFELHRHVKLMESGNFKPITHPVRLAVDFGNFDRSLNHITDKVGEIVAQQTKAEHFRTELITNVSHDLKTPLTSIVNYVDLLSREQMQTEAAEEYLNVLRRQAARLKKLTIDLVDASKASTGTLNVDLMPTNLQVLLEQIAGEYEGQLEKNNLSIVHTAPEETIMILADSRQIWRVFDNLLSNACKYALSGTRVYMDVQTKDERVEIIVKNVSAEPLNISPDMLMERFVRGDKSRHSEGSGLGLSIARDLTALQNGVLELQTDGDLFKAILSFPIYHPPLMPDSGEQPQQEPEEIAAEIVLTDDQITM